MRHRFLAFAIVSIAMSAFGQERDPTDEAYYKKWVGCKAPPVHFDSSDRTNYAEATYKGRKVLLYGFDAGNFARLPDFSRLTNELESLRQVRAKLAEPFAVVGYSRGVLWNPFFGMKGMPKKLERASRFPIVNLNNKRDDNANALGEPLELLESPGGILVGTNGIICAVFLHNLTEADFQAIAATRDWTGPPHEPPPRRKKD
jgi:hypothetical protein